MAQQTRQKINLIISIDTECDKDILWNIPHPITYRNTEYGIQERLTPLFEAFQLKPTYLLSPEIIRHQASVDVLKNLKHAELGTHLHIEFIEPDRIDQPHDTHGYQGALPLPLEKAKLQNLTQLFESTFGYRPTSFRAGRFGTSANTFNILQELGYKVDSSITPFKTLHFDQHRINNWGFYPWPFRIPNTTLTQIPVSIINPGYMKLPTFLLKQLSDQDSLVKKVLRKLGIRGTTYWLRPMRHAPEELIQIAEMIIQATPKTITPTLNIMFHSNEILPMTSPYCKTAEDVDYFISSLQQLFMYLHQSYQVCSIGLSDYETN